MDPTVTPAPITASNHARSCAIATFITVAIWAVVGVVLLAAGYPEGTKSSDPSFLVAVTLLGFAFCSGQGAALTGFMAMKQRQNPLWILPAIVGGLLGVGALLAILGMAVLATLVKHGFVL